jgi:hypothetical protein
MKFLLSTLVALGCMSANATTFLKASSPEAAKAMAIKLMAVGDKYSGPLAIGRISTITWQVELTGLSIPDQNSGPTPVNPSEAIYALRGVKAVVDISAAAHGDPDDTNAWERVEFFFNTKTGFKEDNGRLIAVAKVASIVYDPTGADFMYGTTGCLGSDLEILDLGTTSSLTDKFCYKIKPKYIIEHSL